MVLSELSHTGPKHDHVLSLALHLTSDKDKVMFNMLPDNKILKAFADDKFNMAEMMHFFLWQGIKHCGKRKKCWLEKKMLLKLDRGIAQLCYMYGVMDTQTQRILWSL